jgi:hypothetical protein
MMQDPGPSVWDALGDFASRASPQKTSTRRYAPGPAPIETAQRLFLHFELQCSDVLEMQKLVRFNLE